MKNIFTLTIIFLFLFVGTGLFAQESAPESENTIEHQFDALLESSNNYKSYKVIKKTKVVELQKNTQRKISDLKGEITAAKTQITAQEKEISQLKSSLSETQESLKNAVKAKKEIAFLGIPTDKTTYRLITWGIILILSVILIIFYYKFKNNSTHTKEALKNLQETEDEFEEYRKTALDKQQKLGRMLQDERNKSIKSGVQ